MADIRLIATDLDDTVFGDERIVTERAKTAVRMAQEAGVKVVFITGRMWDSARPYAKLMGVDGPMGCCQGSVVMDTESGRILHHQALEMDVAREVLQLGREEGVYVQYYSPLDFFYEKDCEESRYYQHMSGCPGHMTGKPLEEAMTEPPTKMLYISDPENIRRIYAIAKERMGDRAEIAISKKRYLETTHQNGNKGEALKVVSQLLKVPLENIMTVGDGINDIPMIRAAGLGVAMGDGSRELQAVADVVTAPCHEDGFAKAVEKYVLGKEL